LVLIGKKSHRADPWLQKQSNQLYQHKVVFTINEMSITFFSLGYYIVMTELQYILKSITDLLVANEKKIKQETILYNNLSLEKDFSRLFLKFLDDVLHLLRF